MNYYNKFKEDRTTIETYCRRYDFSKQDKLCVRCNLTLEIREKHNISLDEECIYKSGDCCMSLEKRTRSI